MPPAKGHERKAGKPVISMVRRSRHKLNPVGNLAKFSDDQPFGRKFIQIRGKPRSPIFWRLMRAGVAVVAHSDARMGKRRS